jgi:hypothetical protein
MLLSQKAAEAEQEITRLRLGAMKVMSGVLTSVFRIGIYECQSLRMKRLNVPLSQL